MNFDIVIPSRGDIGVLKNIVESINKQNLKPQNVFIIIDKFLSQDEKDVISYFLFKNIDKNNKNIFQIVCNLNYEFNPCQGVSYVRNFWFDLCSSEYACVIDDDHIFDETFFEKIAEQYQQIKQEIWKDMLFSPTIIFRKTNRIQSQWIKKINFFLSKVVLHKIKKNKNWDYVQMIWANCLFSKTKLFQEIRFDNCFEFVYEDLEFALRFKDRGYPIVVSNTISINHMEKEKSFTERSYIGNPNYAYQKARNRILVVKKNANIFQKIQFFVFGLWVQTVWFVLLVLFFGKWKLKLLRNIASWTRDWLKF